MNALEDDDIDALLRQSFDGPTMDAGFSDRVMRRLPPHRRRFAWPLAMGVLIGAVACALSLVASPLCRDAWQGWIAGEWSAPSLMLLATMAGMALLALGWSFAEAEDR